MKKTFRSILALVLAALMLTATLPLAVFAEGAELPPVFFDEGENALTEEGYRALFETARFTTMYFYDGVDTLWQDGLIHLAGIAAPDLVQHRDDTSYMLLDQSQLETAFSDTFPAYNGFVEKEILPGLKKGEGLGEIPAYNEETGEYLIVSMGDSAHYASSFLYYGFVDQGNGAGTFYFVKHHGFEGEAPILGPDGYAVTLRAASTGVELVERKELAELPALDTMDRTDDPTEDPAPAPRTFDFFWGRVVADFLEGWRDELLKANIANDLNQMARSEMPETVTEEGVAVLTPDQLEELFERSFETPRDFFENEFLPAVYAGETGALTYDKDTNTFRASECGMGDIPNYFYQGWIAREDGNGGSFYYVVVTGEENGNLFFGEEGIRVDLHVEDGRMVEDAYEKITAFPETYDPEPDPQPGDPTEEDRFDREKRTADYVNNYFYGIIREFVGSSFGNWLASQDPTLFQEGDTAVASPEEFEAYYREWWNDAPLGFFEEEIVPAAKANTLSFIRYDAEQDKYLVTQAGGLGGAPAFEYAGWIRGDEGDDAFYFARTEECPETESAAGVKVVVRMEGWDVILISHEKIDALPEEYDAEPISESVYFPYDPYDPTLFQEGDWNYDVVDGKAIIIRYMNDEETDVTVPETLGGYPVTSIGGRAFLYRTAMEKITIPAGVVDIQHDAFFGTDSLREIALSPENKDNRLENGCLINAFDVLVAATAGVTELPAVRHIGDGSLTGRLGESVTIPDTVEDVGNYALADNPDLKTLVLPDSVVGLGDCVLDNVELERICYNGTAADLDAMEIGGGNEEVTGAPVEFTEKRFVGQNAALIAPNGVAPRGATLVDDFFGRLSPEQEARLGEGFVLDGNQATRVALDLDHTPFAPEGTVTVELPVPEQLKGKNVAVLYLPETGDPVEKTGYLRENGAIAFETEELGVFVLAEAILKGNAVLKSAPETVYEEGETISVPEGGTVLVHFDLQYAHLDLVAGWRNDLMEQQGFYSPAEPEVDGDTVYAVIGAGELAAGAQGTLTVSWYHSDDIFGENAPGWADATPVYTCTFTFEVAEKTEPALIWGDANGDGMVSSKDIVRLKNYMANYNTETGTSTVEIFPGADANGDGVVSSKDIVRLKNYMANYNAETGTSTVTLGPAV